jgi:hypothetical protein
VIKIPRKEVNEQYSIFISIGFFDVLIYNKTWNNSIKAHEESRLENE